MNTPFRLPLLFTLMIIMLGACKSLPDHAKYIPKDAVVVVGLNTKKIGRQIAWSALIGSKLFDEMKAKLPQKAAMEGLGDAGIKHMSTSYLYVRTDKQYKGGASVTALVPLDDVKKWEAYVQKTFPQVTIKTVGDRKEANLAEGMYAGWKNDLLVVMNVIEAQQNKLRINIDTAITDTTSFAKGNETLLSSEMQNAFTISESNLTTDTRFRKMENDKHDITVWVNYNVLMQENSDKLGVPSQLALGNMLWKDAAFSGGYDFEKGKITGDMLYYTSEELRPVAEEFGGKDADKELLDRLPTQNLNILMGFHLSTKAIKSLLEKLGVLGFVNLALTSEGLSADDILDAFSGDMGASVNDFKAAYVNQWKASADSALVSYGSYSTSMNFLYVMKISNKQKFDKLIAYLQQKELLKPEGANTLRSITGDSVFLCFDNSYMVISNKPEHAQRYLAGIFKEQAAPPVVKNEVEGNSAGIYLNFQSILNSIQHRQQNGYADSVILSESKRLLDNFVFSGGDYSKNAFSYRFVLNFVNKNENAVFQLMNFALRISEAKERMSSPNPIQANLNPALNSVHHH